jgi:hypothetical protein
MVKPELVRAEERHLVRVAVAVRHPRSRRRFEAKLQDISAGGCQIVSDETFRVGDQILLDVGELQSWPAVVAWLGNGCVGVSFHAALGLLEAEQYAWDFRIGARR